MALAGKAVMLNWSNVAPEHREQYYDWHDSEHIAGRLTVPGFLRGRRHLAIDADRDIFNMYEVLDLGVLTGEDYTRAHGRARVVKRRRHQGLIRQNKGCAPKGTSERRHLA